MEYLLNQEILQILHRVQSTIETVLRRNKPIFSVNDYLLSESGMEKLDAACMLIQTIGENLKSIESQTMKHWKNAATTMISPALYSLS